MTQEPVSLPPQTLLVGEDQETLYIRLIGRGSFQISPALKDYATERIAAGKRRIDVDLDRCVGMDSTFLGTLAGIGLRLWHSGGGALTLRNLVPLTRRQLTMLGLDQLKTVQLIDRDEAPGPGRLLRPMPAASPDRQQTTETMLAAHEDLVRIDPRNEAEFRDLIEILREKVENPEE